MDLGQPFKLCSVVERRSMVERRRPGPQPAAQAAPRPRRGAREAAERGFARFAWSQVKRDFGFEPRPAVEVHPRLRAFLDALDARLRLRGYHPFIRCTVVGLVLLLVTAFTLAICCTTEGRNLANLLLLGGVLHRLVNRPRGAEVHWPSFIRAAAVPAIFLLLSRLSSLADEVRKEREELEEWRRQTSAT